MRKFIFILIIVLLGCQPEHHPKAVDIIDSSIKAHGQNTFDDSQISFTFRNKQYSSVRTTEGYTYKRIFSDTLGMVEDILINGSQLIRLINGDTALLTDKNKELYKNSVNSVLYFTQLPYLLTDQAAIKSYKGFARIGQSDYHVIKVTFKADNGGADFDDEYRYWIDKETHLVDYLAYNYSSDEGGVRFREAYNRMDLDGIIFQDYINYEVPKGTPLKSIPELFEKGKLKEISRIENKDIEVSKTRK